MRTKLVAPRIMKGTIAHWTAGEKAAMLSARGENPAVEMVVNACATAS
jgi:hypothetical protein